MDAGARGAGAAQPRPGPAALHPASRAPLRTAGRRAHSFQMSLFPLILGSVSPCVWLGSCSASSLPLSPTLCIFLENLPLLPASGRPGGPATAHIPLGTLASPPSDSISPLRVLGWGVGAEGRAVKRKCGTNEPGDCSGCQAPLRGVEGPHSGLPGGSRGMEFMTSAMPCLGKSG